MAIPVLPFRDGLIAHLDPTSLGYADGQRVTEAPPLDPGPGGGQGWTVQGTGPRLRRRSDGVAYLQQTSAGDGLRWAQPAYTNIKQGDPTSLGPVMSAEDNVFAGKLWRSIATGSNGVIRQYAPLASLTNGATYTSTVLVANPNAVNVTAIIDWCDQSGDSVTLAPGEIRRLKVTAARATYDNTYRFADLYSGSQAPLYFREFQIEAGTVANPYTPDSYTVTGDYTLFVVARMRGTANFRIVSGLSNNSLFGWWNGGEDRFFGEGWVNSTGSPATTNLKNYAFRRSGATSSIWTAGTLLTSNNTSSQGPSGLTTNGYLGASEFSEAEVYEVILYERAFSDGEIGQISRYLGEKYFSFQSPTSSDGPIVGSITQPVFSGAPDPGTLHVRTTADNLEPDYVDEVVSLDPLDYRRLGESTGPALDWSRKNNSPIAYRSGVTRGPALDRGGDGGTNVGTSTTGIIAPGPTPEQLGATGRNETVMGWYRTPPAGVTPKGGFFKMGGGTGTGYALGVGASTHETLGLNLLALFENVRWISTGVTLSPDTLYHWAMVLDANGKPKVYLGGALVYSDVSTAVIAPTGEYNIGGYDTRVLTKGVLDEVSFHNRELTLPEIQQAYAKGSLASLNLSSPFSQWTLNGGAYVEPDTGDLILPANGAAALSPRMQVGTAANWCWSAEYYSLFGTSTNFPDQGGIYHGSSYYDANGAATPNSAAFNGNGDAQPWPHGSWSREVWSYLAGASVRSVQLSVESSASYSPNSPIRVRNPQFNVGSDLGYYIPPPASVTDTIAREALLIRTASDSAPADDSASRYVFRARTTSDADTTSDSTSRTVDYFRAMTEALTEATDIATRFTSQPRTSSDDVTGTTDAITVDTAILYRPVSESVPEPTDTIFSKASLFRALGDTAPAIDDGTRLPLVLARGSADDVQGVSDTSIRSGTFGRTPGDAAPGDDAATRFVDRDRTSADTVTPTEVAEQNTFQSRTTEETLPAGDAVSHQATLFRNLTEGTFGADDTVSYVADRSRTVADTAGASDDATRLTVHPRTVSDTAPGNDSTERLGQFARNLDESVTPDDSAEGDASLFRVTEDTAEITDSLDHLAVHQRLLGDSAPADDDAVRSFDGSRSIEDNSPAVDNLISYSILVRSSSDAVVVPTDTVSRLGVPFTRDGDSTAPATDDGTRFPITFARFATETIAAPEDSGTREGRPFRRLSTDAAGPAVDIAVRSDAIFGRTPQDMAPVSEEGRANSSQFRISDSDVPAPSDDLTHIAVHVVNLSDDAPAQDAIDAINSATSAFRQGEDLLGEPSAEPESSARAFRATGDTADAIVDTGIRVVIYGREGEVLVPDMTEFIGSQAALFRRTADDDGEPIEWAYARIGDDYRITPRISVLSVSRPKMSRTLGYSTSEVAFYFDAPVIAWTVRLESTSHTDGEALGYWNEFPPTQYGSLTIPSESLHRGTNRITIYAQSLEGVWTR